MDYLTLSHVLNQCEETTACGLTALRAEFAALDLTDFVLLVSYDR